MRNWKYIALFLLLISGLNMLPAQQDPMYSMYMFNGLVINPAYAGSRDLLSTNFVVRRQWMGLEGAPKTYSFSAHAPTTDLRHGLGLSIIEDQIGVSKNLRFDVSYAYRIPFEKDKGNLALGLLAGFDQFRADFSELRTKDPGDNAFEGNKFSIWRPNIGAGIYYNNEKLYAGVSVPSILTNTIHPLDPEQYSARNYVHVLFTAGGLIDLNDVVTVRPSFLARAVKGAPFSLDLNGSVILKDIFLVGASWRIEESVVFLAEIRMTKQLRIGYAFDYGLTELANYHNGSHEFFLGFDFGFSKDRMLSPRNF